MTVNNVDLVVLKFVVEPEERVLVCQGKLVEIELVLKVADDLLFSLGVVNYLHISRSSVHCLVNQLL